MRPEIYTFAFDLYGGLQLIKSSVCRVQGQGPDANKRVHRPTDMVTTRQVRVPVVTGPSRPDLVVEHDCDVMMVDQAEGDVLEDDATVADDIAIGSDPPALTILDSGCTKTMRGTAWAERFEAELSRLGLKFQSQKRKQLFKGVGGQIQSNLVKIYPIGLAKVHGEMCSSEAPGPLPLLLSRPFMEELGAVIDINQGTVHFTAIGVRDLPLLNTSKSHLAVNLLDFDTSSPVGHRGYPNLSSPVSVRSSSPATASSSTFPGACLAAWTQKQGCLTVNRPLSSRRSSLAKACSANAAVLELMNINLYKVPTSMAGGQLRPPSGHCF